MTRFGFGWVIGSVKVRSPGPGPGLARIPGRASLCLIPSEPVGDPSIPVTDTAVTDRPASPIGLGPLRAAPAGLPDPSFTPPTVAEAGDPFTAVRVIDLLARIERGRPVRLADIADRLNATYLDWLFPTPVVADVVLQLQANWMADYRNSGGIVVADGLHGPTVTLEDSSRVDPWIVRQAQREAASCTERLAEFSRRDRPTSGD